MTTSTRAIKLPSHITGVKWSDFDAYFGVATPQLGVGSSAAQVESKNIS